MASDTVVRARIDLETKRDATAALEAMGLSVSDAIRLLLVRVAEERRLPFEIKVPNAASVEAMDELDKGGGKRFDTIDELFEDLSR
jgi:DNA-damage-inducible protein J